MKPILIVGTRPQVIKAAPLVAEAKRRGIELPIINTGQHFDDNMNAGFYKELGLPDPVADLDGGSIIKMASAIRKELLKLNPTVVLVPGDTDSAVAATIAAKADRFRVGHIEAGPRSFDPDSVEEGNRCWIDSVAEHLFAPTQSSLLNLKHGRLTGDVLFDMFSESRRQVRAKDGDFILLTIHRQENVAQTAKLRRFIRHLTGRYRVVFPCHPRTAKALGLSHALPPLGYLPMLGFVASCRLVVTDSGGLQREAFWSGKPCIVAREYTEWPETKSPLVGLDTKRLDAAIKTLEPPTPDAEFGDGHAAQRVFEALL